MTEKHGHFCVLPWLHRFTNVGGEVQVCCSSEGHDNAVRDEAGNPFSIERIESDAEVMNSKFMKTLRLEMLSGKWPKLCERCRLTELSGSASRRINENHQYADRVESLLGSTKEDGEIPVEIVSSDLRVGNLCNLTCRMCNPRSSSKWAPDWPKLKRDFEGLLEEEKGTEEVLSYDWYKSPKVVEQLKRQLPTLKHLHFAGGEPLLVPEMFKFLKACIESGYSRGIELSYNTNITRLPEEAKRLWPEFRGVKLLCSVDAHGPLNDVIRGQSRWQWIDRNLRDIDANHARYGITQALIMCTVQVSNLFAIGDLYDYLANEFRFVEQIPYLVDLHAPELFRTQILPLKLKKQALQRLREIETRTLQRISEGLIPAAQESHLATLRGIMNFLLMEDLQGLAPAYLQITESHDKLRGENLLSLVPELRDLKALVDGRPE